MSEHFRAARAHSARESRSRFAVLLCAPLLLQCAADINPLASEGLGDDVVAAEGALADPNARELIRAHFSNTPVGTYRRDMVRNDFGVAPPWANGLDQGRARIVQEGSNRFMRVTYPANKFGPNEGGVQFVAKLDRSYNELYFSYRVRFASGFNFVMGGKLPGLVGGTSPSGCKPDPNGFSARNMWRTSGAAVQYVYYPTQPNKCGDDRYYKENGANVRFVPGRWHTVEHRIVMNTPGQKNGVLQAWFDGRLVYNDSARLWRNQGASYAIDALYFSTFFGGGSQVWAPTSAQSADFDDLIVATGKINGSSGTPGEGTLSIGPSRDAYVRDGQYANTNFGTADSLQVKGVAAAGYNRTSFIRFDGLSALRGKSVSVARLRVYVASLSRSGTGLRLYQQPAAHFPGTSTMWTETGITWTNRPAPGNYVGIKTLTGAGFQEYDVTGAIDERIRAQANTVTFVFQDAQAQDSHVTLHSRENVNAPQLQVTYR